MEKELPSTVPSLEGNRVCVHCLWKSYSDLLSSRFVGMEYMLVGTALSELTKAHSALEKRATKVQGKCLVLPQQRLLHPR